MLLDLVVEWVNLKSIEVCLFVVKVKYECYKGLFVKGFIFKEFYDEVEVSYYVFFVDIESLKVIIVCCEIKVFFVGVIGICNVFLG